MDEIIAWESGEAGKNPKKAGTVEINWANQWRPCNPFGGYRKSGPGQEHRDLGIHELCQVKVLSEER